MTRLSKARLIYLAVFASLFAQCLMLAKGGHALPFLPDGMGDGHL